MSSIDNIPRAETTIEESLKEKKRPLIVVILDAVLSFIAIMLLVSAIGFFAYYGILLGQLYLGMAIPVVPI